MRLDINCAAMEGLTTFRLGLRDGKGVGRKMHEIRLSKVKKQRANTPKCGRTQRNGAVIRTANTGNDLKDINMTLTVVSVKEDVDR